MPSYTTYVINNAEQTYANAYFEINYVNIYSNTKSNATSGSGSSSSASGTGATNTVGTRPSGSVASGAAAQSSRAAGAQRWEGLGLGWMIAVAAGVVGGVAMVL